jgi:hypothetical protein
MDIQSTSLLAQVEHQVWAYTHKDPLCTNFARYHSWSIVARTPLDSCQAHCPEEEWMVAGIGSLEEASATEVAWVRCHFLHFRRLLSMNNLDTRFRW